MDDCLKVGMTMLVVFEDFRYIFKKLITLRIFKLETSETTQMKALDLLFLNYLFIRL